MWGIFHTTECQGQPNKREEEERRGSIQRNSILSSQVTVTHDGALLSWGWVNTCLPMKSGELFLALFARACCFALSIKLSIFQPMTLSTCTSSNLFPIPLQGSEGAAVWCCSQWLGLKPPQLIGGVFFSSTINTE